MSINQYDATNDKLSKVAGLYTKTEDINAKDVYLESGESVEDAINKLTSTDTSLVHNVDLTSYVKGTSEYTAPVNGYVWIRNLPSSGHNGRIFVYNSWLSIGGQPGDFGLYVKKGCTICVEGTCQYAFFRSDL